MKSSPFYSMLLTGFTFAVPMVAPLSNSASLTGRFHSLLPRAAQYATTANELTDGTACKDITLIYARGTTQEGNIGSAGDVGPLMMNNLSAILGVRSLAVQGVDYEADIGSFLANLAGINDEGSETMKTLVERANTQCPETMIVMSGYSQGGQIIHDAADALAANTAAVDQIAAVLIFGDPQSEEAVGNIPADKVKVICHDGDKICESTPFVLPPHLDYQIDAQTAAEFIALMVQ